MGVVAWRIQQLAIVVDKHRAATIMWLLLR